MANFGKILVIDDEEEMGEFVSATALSLGLPCSAATDAAELRSFHRSREVSVPLDRWYQR
jgi:DNA-binding response OmpR family regulator